MYTQVEKSKDNKSKAVANSVGQEKTKGNEGVGFVDNRSETRAHKNIQMMMNNYLKVKPYKTLQRSADRNIIQRRITVNNGGAMAGPFNAVNFTNARRNDAQTAIQNLTYAHIWGGARTQTNTTHVRVDVQGLTGAGQNNIQAQINGVGAPSTVAHILVNPNAQALLIPAVSPARSIAQQAEIRRRAVGALFSSLNDYRGGNPTTYIVNGPPSS